MEASEVLLEEQNVFHLKLPYFQGPIELLYHLIQKKSLDINEISLGLITDEFLLYLENYKTIEHFKIAGFIEVASHFVYLKSCALLPDEEVLGVDSEELDYRKDLVLQLIEYSKMKKGFEFLKARKDFFSTVRGENQTLKEIKKLYHIDENVSVAQLLDLTAPFFKEAPSIPLSKGEVTIDFLTVEDRIKWWEPLLKLFNKVSFFKTVKKFRSIDKIMSFLASLELGKQRKITLEQEDLFGDILLQKVKKSKKDLEEELQ